MKNKFYNIFDTYEFAMEYRKEYGGSNYSFYWFSGSGTVDDLTLANYIVEHSKNKFYMPENGNWPHYVPINARYFIILYHLMIQFPVAKQMAEKGIGYLVFNMARNIASYQRYKNFKELFSSGNTIEEVTGLPEKYQHYLESVNDVKTVIEIKKFVNNYAKNKKEKQMFFDFIVATGNINHLSQTFYKRFKYVMNSKKIKFDSLIKYLNRVEQNEAIKKVDAINIIYEYLRAMKALNREPNFKTNSLKREFDLALRDALNVPGYRPYYVYRY